MSEPLLVRCDNAQSAIYEAIDAGDPDQEEAAMVPHLRELGGLLATAARALTQSDSTLRINPITIAGRRPLGDRCNMKDGEENRDGVPR